MTEQQSQAFELVRKEFKIELRNNESIPAFGAALIPEDPETDEPIMLVNIGSCLLCSLETETDFKQLVLETVMHEFGHVLEHWLGLEASEDRIEGLVELYREKYGKAEDETAT